MLNLMRYDSNEMIPLHLEAQIRSLVSAEWPASNAREITQPLVDPELHPSYFVLADGDQLLSCARTIWQIIFHLEQRFKLYGLGDVITKPEFRNKGYGGRIVDEATAYIKSDRDADAALLQTDSNLEMFYRRSGWCHFSELRVVTDETDKFPGETGFSMMLLFSAKAHQILDNCHKKPLLLSGEEW